MPELTPMMKQYMEVKDQCKDCILFFRLGDFYEMFFEDAKTASKVLEITLTGRDCGLAERAPMCGVPYHSAQTYISKLLVNGYKVAVCEQVEDPALAKGIVKREIVRIYTPGTVTDETMLDMRKNNFLMSLYCFKNLYGIATADVSTGEFKATSISYGNTKGKLFDEIAKIEPSEIVINNGNGNDELIKEIKNKFGIYISIIDDELYERKNAEAVITQYFSSEALKGREYELSINAAGALLSYIMDSQKMPVAHIKDIDFYSIEEFMMLDMSSRRNLELTETMRAKNKKGSLLWVLDRTKTSMGGRLLRKWLEEPLLRVDDINERLDAVEEFFDSFIMRAETREIFGGVYDIERLTGKIALGNVNPKDFVSLKNSLGQIPSLKEVLNNASSTLVKSCFNNLDPLDDLYDTLDRAIVDEPPTLLKDGGFIKTGFNAEVDKLRRASTEGKDWVAQMEADERQKTGIKNLKIGYNRVFGYYLEVTKSNLSSVPDNYIRKQTLTNAERYITQELKEIEDNILDADENLIKLESQLFVELKEFAAERIGRLKTLSESIAILDVLSTLAEVAEREGYCKPTVNDGDIIDIKESRHPVVEQMMEDEFVPNDICLDKGDNRFLIITGPNMAGKSTYMRQTALNVLMAQIGSFVPAKEATIGICDRIFTRVGASDDLASGQSTFMVEMTEVTNILKNATKDSLLILDEIGRGTSTFDGLSIAWAVVEYVANKKEIGARTMFATHYHELNELEGKIEGVKNYCVDVKKTDDGVIFLRKIIRGGTDDSYGIEVAKLAGMPQAVVNRADSILKQLESSDLSKKESIIMKRKKQSENQVDILTFVNNTVMSDEIITELKKLDLQTLTPLEALNKLYELQQKALKKE